jgi:hypothetical protein
MGQGLNTIHVSGQLESGLYFVRLSNGADSETVKLMISK